MSSCHIEASQFPFHIICLMLADLIFSLPVKSNFPNGNSGKCRRTFIYFYLVSPRYLSLSQVL